MKQIKRQIIVLSQGNLKLIFHRFTALLFVLYHRIDAVSRKKPKNLDFPTRPCYNSKEDGSIVESLRFMISLYLFFFQKKRYNRNILRKEWQRK